jgi:hypothetical protein
MCQLLPDVVVPSLCEILERVVEVYFMKDLSKPASQFALLYSTAIYISI